VGAPGQAADIPIKPCDNTLRPSR